MEKPSVQERLLDAGLKLMSEKGYLGATTRGIAQAAGVTELTLFRHFGSKERLFEEVLKTYSFLPTLEGLLPALESMAYEDGLKLLGGHFFENLKERKSLIKIMLSEITSYPNKVSAVYSSFIPELVGMLAGHLRALQEKGVLREFSPELGARSFLGTFFSYFLSEEIMAARVISEKEMETVVDEFTGLFISGTSHCGLRISECGIDKI
ncbi:MAG: TetR/AcrR family transcriptional regulator [Pseudomonadota bacterium]